MDRRLVYYIVTCKRIIVTYSNIQTMIVTIDLPYKLFGGGRDEEALIGLICNFSYYSGTG